MLIKDLFKQSNWPSAPQISFSSTDPKRNFNFPFFVTRRKWWNLLSRCSRSTLPSWCIQTALASDISLTKVLPSVAIACKNSLYILGFTYVSISSSASNATKGSRISIWEAIMSPKCRAGKLFAVGVANLQSTYFLSWITSLLTAP